ncbi:hypothetical protein [Desulfosporosinus sp. BG]|nr:hypothetical protein [Desulfosporosinus sp. BG]ODA39180.1 hypothetical protein DSBG_4033 [Desulfosporosinus sp. BG]
MSYQDSNSPRGLFDRMLRHTSVKDIVQGVPGKCNDPHCGQN